MSRTFSHAGDGGDIAYALPAIRALGGGTLCVHAEKWTREPMTEAKRISLHSLLIKQPYIDDVRWLRPGEKVDVNLNDFRAEYFRIFRTTNFPRKRNLCEWVLRTHGVSAAEQDIQWLEVESILAAPVIINRTARYQNGLFPWGRVVDKYRDVLSFVGSREEHYDFCRQFGEVYYRHTTTLLELAQVIAGSKLFIGNQSCAYAIAEGLKKRAILEVCHWLPNCLFYRSDCTHGWDATIELPDL